VTEHANRKYVAALRKALRAAAVPENAGPMQAYMKSEMPFYGVKKPERAKCSKEVIAAHPLDSYEAWRDTALALYRGARKREERYGALDLVGHRSYREYRDRWASFAMYDEFIVTGAWWDLVDETAVQHLGRLMVTERQRCTAKMRRWMKGRDLWRRRSSIICQLKLKRETDLGLLFDSIEASMESEEFFLRKGIGWALREYAKTDPQVVIDFVQQRQGRLSALSKREALRRVLKDGLIDSIP
jgi:3-methyladenine DNA glycosylase AlkD